MPKNNVSDIAVALTSAFNKIVRLRTTQLNPVILHLSRAIEEFDKFIKKHNKKIKTKGETA